jgi:hypothetical protein
MTTDRLNPKAQYRPPVDFRLASIIVLFCLFSLCFCLPFLTFLFFAFCHFLSLVSSIRSSFFLLLRFPLPFVRLFFFGFLCVFSLDITKKEEVTWCEVRAGSWLRYPLDRSV